MGISEFKGGLLNLKMFLNVPHYEEHNGQLSCLAGVLRVVIFLMFLVGGWGSLLRSMVFLPRYRLFAATGQTFFSRAGVWTGRWMSGEHVKFRNEYFSSQIIQERWQRLFLDFPSPRRQGCQDKSADFCAPEGLCWHPWYELEVGLSENQWLVIMISIYSLSSYPAAWAQDKSKSLGIHDLSPSHTEQLSGEGKSHDCLEDWVTLNRL